MKEELKNALPSVAFYGLFASGTFFLNKLMPSGPCAPGPAILLVFLLPLVSFVLFIKNSFQRFIYKTPNTLVLGIHGIVFAAFFYLYLKIS